MQRQIVLVITFNI